MRKLMGAAAVAAVLWTGAAQADVIFGSETPTPACTATSGGAICAVTEKFSEATATESGGAALTLKSAAINGAQDAGVGVSSSATACQGGLCEAETGQTVTITAAAGFMIHDAIIGSVDSAAESFSFSAGGVLVGSNISGTNCNAPGFTVSGITCVWNGTPVSSISVTDQTGSIVVSEISTTSTSPPGVNEPTAMGIFATALLTFGLVYTRQQRR